MSLSWLDNPEFEKLLIETDLAYFSERILNIEVAEHHKDWSSLIAKNKRLAINAARDHGKSYFFSLAYVLWRAYFAWKPSLKDVLEVNVEAGENLPKVSMGYIYSNTQTQAIALLEIVKREIESNPFLRHLKPSYTDSWSKMEVVLSNGAVIRARGYGTAVRGAHPCWLVADDVLNDESIYSELTRKKTIEYFYSAISPMVVPGGQIIVVGTPMHREDLYQVLKTNRRYVFRSYAATPEKPLWPGRYSKKMLEEKREEIGTTRFAREFECVPISDESTLFPENILAQCYDDQFEMPRALTPELRNIFKNGIYTGMDLALSASVGADYTVITTIGIDEFKTRYILNIFRKRGMTMTEQLHALQEIHSNFRPNKIFVEDNAYQRVFRDELVRSTDMPVEGYTTTARSKNSMESGVPSLQMLFENRKFVIPRKTERDRVITDALCGELRCFTWLDGKLQGVGSHDDMVMSLFLANECYASSSFNFVFA